MGKYLDIKVGKKLKLYRLATGTKQDGNLWGLFSYTPFEKKDNGDYIYGQEYTIFMNNLESGMNLKDGDFVEVANILSVSAEDNTYKGKDGVQHTKRIIKVSIDIKIENKTNENLNENTQYGIYDNTKEDNPAIADSDYELPNF